MKGLSEKVGLVLLIGLTGTVWAEAPPAPPVATAPDAKEELEELNEIIVTGTHIRGVTNPTTSVQIYTRDDIDRTGVATLQDFIRRLPQNFNGGASDSTLSSVAGGGNAVNTVGATGINLRGLGNESTLILVNGRRIAPGNTLGNFVDISMIPLNAVDRIEIVTDGASAIYGSDAVAGVVNFVLRRDLEGYETRLHYASDAQGGTHESEVGQVIGHRWSSGSALLSYEYWDRAALAAADRSYSQDLLAPFSLLPQQLRHGAFLTIDQSLTSGIEAFAEGSFAHRATSQTLTSPFASSTEPAKVDSYSGTLGARIELPRAAQVELSVTYGASDTRTQSLMDGLLVADNKVRSDLLSVDVKVDGSWGSTHAGPIRYAAGAQYRTEGLDERELVGLTEFDPSRHIAAGFLELRVPLVGPAQSSSQWGERLTLSLADRAEHYNDFGSTHNPQIGLLWRPTQGFLLRAAWGTSFHAPLLDNLNPNPFQVVAFPEADPSTGGTTNSLIVFGGNPDLDPEKATTWTLGLEVRPERVPGLSARLSYYDIRFTKRIVNAQSEGVDITDALRLESILGPQIIQRNPPQSLVTTLTDTPAYFNPFQIDRATIAAIVDSRWLNLAAKNTRGIDFELAHFLDTRLGQVRTGFAGTYILKLENQFTAASPFVSVLNTVYNPVNLKLQAHAALTHGPLTSTLFLNYVNHYKDNRAPTLVPVASWTTVDATFDYNFGDTAGLLDKTSILLGVLNIGNVKPPYAAPQFPGSYGGAAFDGANANVLGRYYSLQVSRRW